MTKLLERILVLDSDAKCTVFDNDYDLLVWDVTNASPQPTAVACLAVTTLELSNDIRDKARQLAKDKLADDPVFATLAQAVVVLKAAADGTTLNVAKQALLDDLESRIT